MQCRCTKSVEQKKPCGARRKGFVFAMALCLAGGPWTAAVLGFTNTLRRHSLSAVMLGVSCKGHFDE